MPDREGATRAEYFPSSTRTDETGSPPPALKRRRRHAEIAQLVEHAPEKRGVAGSIPALGKFKPLKRNFQRFFCVTFSRRDIQLAHHFFRLAS